MHSRRTRDAASAMLARGRTISETARALDVPRRTVQDWATGIPRREPACWRCDTAPTPDADAYAALLGFYLGDGCVSEAARCQVLRVSCDARLPGIVDDVAATVDRVRPGATVHRVAGPGTTVVQSAWQHWGCVLPQHGPGRKHERPIVLEPWQVDLVHRAPAALLRGLLHSDGSRFTNTATAPGRERTYSYSRWQFTNRSEDILGLCTWALDLVEVPWRRSGPWTVSVSRRAGVARLDALVGPKV